MKTAVSIPDDLFAEAEQLAAERAVSRSALYAEALRALVKRAKDDAVTADLNAALSEEANDLDPAFRRHVQAKARRDGEAW